MRVEDIQEQLRIIEATHISMEMSRNQMMQDLDKAGTAIDDIKRLLAYNERDERLRRTLTVQEILDRIARLDLIHKEDQPKQIVFDFAGASPLGLISWRGKYQNLSVSFHFNFSAIMTVDAFVDLLNESIGKTYEGYKGGNYKMDKDTPVWVDNYGEYTNTGILGVIDIGYQIVIETGYCEF